MTIEDVLGEHEALGSEKMRSQNARAGAIGDQYGVRRGDLRALAKKLKNERHLAKPLWATDNIDAQFLSCLLLRPKDLSADEIDEMVRGATFDQVTDWFTNYVVKKHPQCEYLRQRWLASDHPMTGRAGWSLTYDRITKQPEGLDFDELLRRIESEMSAATPETQWTMNFALVGIGASSPDHRDRAIEIGEALGMYRDYPVTRGCTSPTHQSGSRRWSAARVEQLRFEMRAFQL